MYPAGQHPIYPYTEEDKRIVLENAGVKKDQLEKDVEVIREWVQKQPHLSEAGIDPWSAASHLIMSKGSVERAKQKIDSYYRERARNVQNREERVNLLTEQYRPVWHTHVIAPIPKLHNGSRVQYMKIYDWDNYKLEDMIVNIGMLADIRYANDFSSNETYVIDLKDATLGHILKLNHSVLSQAYRTYTKLGVRIFAIHLVNCSAVSVIQALINLCTLFLSKKLLDRIKFHETPEGLFKYLPREYILQDYEGDMPSYDFFRDKMEKLIAADEKTKQFLIDACKVISDESKRPKDEYDEEYLQGNFKKLDLD